MKTIGILGGMGPEATVLLMQKVIAARASRDDADHVPLLVDQNTQVPSRIRHLIDQTGDDPAPVLAAMALRLQVAGVHALAMPCNTAHHYAPAIRAAVSIPLIDMVALSVSHAANLAPPNGTVGILASPAVRLTGLFDCAFAAVGLTAIYAQDDDDVLSVIRRIKADGPVLDARHALAELSRGLVTRGAQLQMIACTEFSLIADALDAPVSSFDTLDRLVEGILDFSTATEKDQDRADSRPPTVAATVRQYLPNKETTQ